jgi:hypothetical protein
VKINIIDRNNAKENAYQMNNKVLYKNVMDSKFSGNPWKEPRIINHHKNKLQWYSQIKNGNGD